MAQNVIINGVTYSNVPSVQIPKAGGGTAQFFDPADATAVQADILSGKTAYISGGAKSGTMPNNGAVGGTIAVKAGTIAIPAGYTSGGAVEISQTEQAKIVSGNIKSGVTILGVGGAASVVDTTISSGGATAAQILAGYKAYVGGSLVTGNLSVPTVSQDGTTHVLTIQ